MIEQANGWYYVGKIPSYDVNGKQTKLIKPVALWKLCDDQTVVGMISFPYAGQDGVNGRPELMEVPPLEGVYKTYAELTRDEKELLLREMRRELL